MSELLQVNKKIKNFKVLLDNGEKSDIKHLLGEKGLILYFYPKDNTPGCTKEACSFRDDYDKFREIGYNIVGVSTDSMESHQKFKQKYQLNFPLIVDEDKELSNYFGVWGEKKMYGKTFEGINRTTFILNKDLKILKVYPKVKVETHTTEILKDLNELQ